MPTDIIFAPEWATTTARLSSIPWAAHVGQALPASLATWCTPVASAAEALDIMSGDDWDAWSADGRGDLTSFLSLRHSRRSQDWNAIVRVAKENLAPHRPAIMASLAAAGLSDKIAMDTVEWDVVGALTCAAFMDCRPPADELRLLDVYAAGHLPVGWDAGRRKVLAF